MRVAVAAILLCAVIAVPARAFDKVLLKDGRTIEGTLAQGGDASVVKLTVNGIEIPIPAAEVEKTFVENLAGYKPATPEEAENLKKGWVLFEGHWLSKSARDDLLAKRAAADKAAIDETRKRQNWKNAVTKESTHFTMKTNADDALAADYLARLEEFYKDFTDAWGVKVAPTAKSGKLSVELHRSYGDLINISIGGGKIYVAFNFGDGAINLYYNAEDPEATLRDLYQGAFWQLNFFINPKFYYPSWIRNGLAAYYATATHAPDGSLKFGTPQYGYLQEIQRGRKENKLPPLMEILDDENTKWSYAHSAVRWSFTYFLMESPKYSKSFKAFAGNLPNNKEAGIKLDQFPQKGQAHEYADPKLCIAAMEKRLGTSIDKLEAEWKASLDKPAPMTADAYFLAAQSTLAQLTDREDDDDPIPQDAAERSVQTAFDQFAAADAAGIQRATCYRDYAELLREGGLRRGDVKALPRKPDGAGAFKMAQKAIALGPTDAFNYIEAGEDLIVEGPAQDLDKAATYADVAKAVAGSRDLFVKALAETVLAKIEPAREQHRKAAQQVAAATASTADTRRWFVAFFFVQGVTPPDNLKDLTTQQVRDLIRGGKVGPEDSVFQSWRNKDPKTGELIPGTDPWDAGWVKVKDCSLFKDDLAAAPAPGNAPAGGAAPGGAAVPKGATSGSGG